MQVEFHQLDCRLEHLPVRNPQRQRRLLASLAEVGQQTPIVVIAVADVADRYLVIDEYKRIAARGKLGRDTVEAVVRAMGEAEALAAKSRETRSPARSLQASGIRQLQVNAQALSMTCLPLRDSICFRGEAFGRRYNDNRLDAGV